METSSGGHRRTQVLVDPRRQLRFAFFLIGGGITALMVFNLFLLISLKASVQEIAANGHLSQEMSTVLLDSVANAELNVTAMSLLLMTVSIVTGIVLSHRIYGPIVKIRQHVEAMNNGNFKSRIQLRSNDHFIELSEDLNQLAETLERGRRA